MTDATSLSLSPDRYIAERVHAYQAWYDKKAVQAKARYLRMRAFSVIGGGLVPVLINITPDFQVGRVFVLRSIVTTISLLVVIAVSLESVFHYREQWKNYRSTEQLLGHETFRFRAGIGPYDDLSVDEAFHLFVERVEDAIAAENTATLNVMTLAVEAADEGQRRKGSGE
jgi:hypothetical protein